jgi:peptide chain release factor subunit 1
VTSSASPEGEVELRQVDRDALRRLGRMGGEGRHVLSVFLSPELPLVPRARVRGAVLDSELNEVGHRLRQEVGEGPARKALDSCLARVGERLENAVVTDREARAVAVFCEEPGEIEAFGLSRAPDFAVAGAFRERAAIEPLVEALPGPAWGVALVSRKHGRIFRGTEAGLAELSDVDDEVHRRHAQGGWSQARYQRGVEKETKDHVEHVCERLFALHRRRPFDRLALGGPAEILPLVEAKLHPYLRERLAGHVAVDVERAGAEEVLEQMRGLIVAERRRRESEAIARLEEGLGTGDGAVAGLADVLAALGDRRVGTLLVHSGPLDEGVERAVEAAVAQSAEVLVVGDGVLDRFGEIAALLRY